MDSSEKNYLHLVCPINESDMDLLICELNSMVDWISMCLKNLMK